jgi:hypothetical protein
MNHSEFENNPLPESYIVDIPFYGNMPSEIAPYGEYCHQMCVKMILESLMPETVFGLDELVHITGKRRGGTYPTHTLIWLVEHGFEVVQRASFDWEAFRDRGPEYYAELGEGQLNYNARSDLEYEQRAVDSFLNTVNVIRERPTVDDIKRAIVEGWYVRVGVDAGVLNPEKQGYFGHSVVPIGYEENDILFHDPGLPQRQARRETIECFQAAMDSFGGIMDQIRL